MAVGTHRSSGTFTDLADPSALNVGALARVVTGITPN